MWSLLEMLSEKPLLTVLDIGAAFNETPPYQRLIDAGCARIVGFEPNAAACAELNRSYGPPHTFLPYFIGDGGAAVFHETSHPLTGSLFEPNVPLLAKFQSLPEYVAPVARHPVTTTRLDDLTEIGDVDFIKIDVQGSELAIFENATRVLAATLLVQTEVNFVELYKGQPLFADVDICLRRQGMQFHAIEGLAGRAFKPLLRSSDPDQGFRQILWADVHYVRDWMRLDALPANKLRKYALLAHDLLKSYDLAHLALETLDRKTGNALAPAYRQRLIAGG